MTAAELIFCADSEVRSVYSDELDLSLLAAFGVPSIARASQVEPTADHRWNADLAPVGGPLLGPFALRAQALEAERAWLDEHLSSLTQLPIPGAARP